ncbi:MAG: arylsulfatase family protein, partial [Phycisphaerales bacterium]|nr:arylsulfatase family protein [Phycisphaerales bacterium]
MESANAPAVIDRRGFLNWAGRGVGAVALAALLQRDSAQGAVAQAPSALTPHWAARAKRAIHIVLVGGLSQVDSFDYKPGLAKFHGKSMAGGDKPDVFFGQVGLIRQSDWEFKQRGRGGLWVSELFPHIATAADELTLIRSMVAETSNHTPATFQQNTGFRLNGFPVLGSWLSYGLGSVND